MISDVHMTFGTLVNVSQSQKPYSKNIKNKIYFMKLVKSDPHGDANLIINFISPYSDFSNLSKWRRLFILQKILFEDSIALKPC